MFSDEIIGMSFAHQREMRQFGRQAQALIDEMDRDVVRLRRQLAAAQRTNTDLVLERGRRNNAMLIARMARN